MDQVLKLMTGEELLTLRILKGVRVAAGIDVELDRRAAFAVGKQAAARSRWAVRQMAYRQPAGLAA